MKLRLITEGSLTEVRQVGWDKPYKDYRTNQAAKNLIYTALSKLRDMLGPLGLLKQGHVEHQTPEPIAPAATAFNRLRNAVRAKAQRDAARISADQGHLPVIRQFWGFKTPESYYDFEAGPHGKREMTGQFDGMIRRLVAAAQGKSVEARIELLNQFADAFSR